VVTSTASSRGQKRSTQEISTIGTADNNSIAESEQRPPKVAKTEAAAPEPSTAAAANDANTTAAAVTVAEAPGPATAAESAFAGQLRLRDRMLAVPVPAVDGAAPLTVGPCLIEMNYEHPRYGAMTVKAELWWVDAEQPDGFKIRPTGYERYYIDKKAGKTRMAESRVCYFHVIRSVEPQHTPCSTMINEWFSSFNASATALGNSASGWSAWHVYQNPKLTMGHVTRFTGFKNHLQVSKPCELNWVQDWMCKPRMWHLEHKSLLWVAMSLGLGKEKVNPNLAGPRRLFEWYIPYRDFFAAQCRYECNEHECSGGESEATRFQCCHGIDHEPYETPEDEDDVPMFHVPKKVAMFRPGDDDDEVRTAAGDREDDAESGGIAKKQAKAAAKLVLKNKNHVPTPWDARIILDRMDARQFKRAKYSSDVHHILNYHMDVYRNADEFARVTARIIPSRALWSQADWDRMMLTYDVAPNQTFAGFNPASPFPLVTFELRRRADAMAIVCAPTSVKFNVRGDVVKANRPALYKQHAQQ